MNHREQLTTPHYSKPIVLRNPHATNNDTVGAYISELERRYPGLVILNSEKNTNDTSEALYRAVESAVDEPDLLIVVSGDGVFSQVVDTICNARNKKDRTSTENLLSSIVIMPVASGNGCDGHREYAPVGKQPPMPDEWRYIKSLYPMHLQADFPNQDEKFTTYIVNYFGCGISAALMQWTQENRDQLAKSTKFGRIIMELSAAFKKTDDTCIINNEALSDYTIVNTARIAKLGRTGTSHAEEGFREMTHGPFSKRREIARLAFKVIAGKPLGAETIQEIDFTIGSTGVPVQIDGDFIGQWPEKTQVRIRPVDPIKVASTIPPHQP